MFDTCINTPSIIIRKIDPEFRVFIIHDPISLPNLIWYQLELNEQKNENENTSSLNVFEIILWFYDFDDSKMILPIGLTY